ncbi:MAG: hypothetical protein ABSG49_03125 [Methanoregula sp.]|jgi:hypothetical protein|uniref:hypothetical protein n=1 Tax=Methanoregula sp. TaxID=2052170 RepID=UPI003C20E3A5
MDEIEKGFETLEQKIAQLQEDEKALTGKLKENDAKLLKKMAASSVTVVKIVGLNMLKKGKQDTKGEMYDPMYYPQKMIILGKSELAAFRPDNPAMPVTDQFCVLSEDGEFFELMYSFDGFLTDSYLNPLDAKKALELYGYDVMYMLYRAMRDYLTDEKKLVDALEIVVGYVFAKKP